MKKWIVSLFVSSILTVLLAQAQQMQGLQREDPSYQSAGRLILFVAVPKDKSLRLYLVGREAMELNLKNEPKLLSVRLLDKDRSRDLKFQKHGNAYEIVGTPPRGSYNLDVKAEIGSQSDSVRMSIGVP